MSKFSDIWARIYYFPRRPPLQVEQIEPDAPPKELSPEERRAKFRSALTDRVSAGWHLEIENEFDAVISRKKDFNWIGSFLLFILLFFIFAPIAFFYLIVLVIVKITARPKTVRIWIDIFGDIKNNA
jgi:hypothetical protein